jgi:hypothetical protein
MVDKRESPPAERLNAGLGARGLKTKKKQINSMFTPNVALSLQEKLIM